MDTINIVKNVTMSTMVEMLILEDGISETQYNEIAQNQDWKCKICNSEHYSGQFTRLVIDHCHKNGGVRGLICQSCNMALGNAKDNPEILRKMVDYLDDFYG